MDIDKTSEEKILLISTSSTETSESTYLWKMIMTLVLLYDEFPSNTKNEHSNIHAHWKDLSLCPSHLAIKVQ